MMHRNTNPHDDDNDDKRHKPKNINTNIVIPITESITNNLNLFPNHENGSEQCETCNNDYIVKTSPQINTCTNTKKNDFF